MPIGNAEPLGKWAGWKYLSAQGIEAKRDRKWVSLSGNAGFFFSLDLHTRPRSLPITISLSLSLFVPESEG